MRGFQHLTRITGMEKGIVVFEALEELGERRRQQLVIDRTQLLNEGARLGHAYARCRLLAQTRTQRLVQLSRAFAEESGIQHFYDANQTILHTKFYRDLVQPGTPGVVRPRLQNRPALQRPALQQRRPPAPKGKPPPKEKH